jgi:hypothetical protein
VFAAVNILQVKSLIGQPKLKRQQNLKARQGGIPHGPESLDVIELKDESILQGLPVLWMTLDPNGEWLAGVEMEQPLHMWVLQLQHVS